MMFVDVVRSTESVQRIGDSAWSRMLDRYESITFRHVSAAHG
jgi:hypothetical protein